MATTLMPSMATSDAIANLQGNRAKIKTCDLNSGASTTISGVQNGILAITRGATGLYGLFWGSGTNTLSGGSNLSVSLSNSNLTITNNAGMTCVCILIYN